MFHFDSFFYFLSLHIVKNAKVFMFLKGVFIMKNQRIAVVNLDDKSTANWLKEHDDATVKVLPADMLDGLMDSYSEYGIDVEANGAGYLADDPQFLTIHDIRKTNSSNGSNQAPKYNPVNTFTSKDGIVIAHVISSIKRIRTEDGQRKEITSCYPIMARSERSKRYLAKFHKGDYVVWRGSLNSYILRDANGSYTNQTTYWINLTFLHGSWNPTVRKSARNLSNNSLKPNYEDSKNYEEVISESEAYSQSTEDQNTSRSISSSSVPNTVESSQTQASPYPDYQLPNDPNDQIQPDEQDSEQVDQKLNQSEQEQRQLDLNFNSASTTKKSSSSNKKQSKSKGYSNYSSENKKKNKPRSIKASDSKESKDAKQSSSKTDDLNYQKKSNSETDVKDQNKVEMRTLNAQDINFDF